MSIAGKGKIIPPEVRKKISKSKKGIPMTLKHRRKLILSRQKCPNKFEEKCIKLFKEKNIPLKFVGDLKEGEFYMEGKVPDFASTNNKKIIVEVFHDYYKIRRFGSIEKYKKERKKVFSKYGWKTLFLRYNNMISDPQKYLTKLKNEIES